MKEGRASPASSEPASKAGNLSPGVGVLLRGANGTPKAARTDEDSQGGRQRNFQWKRLIQLSLCLADLVLLGLAARLALKANGPMGGTDLTFCVIALVLGAGLTCLAFGWDKLGD
jgi:hypothetical protein